MSDEADRDLIHQARLIMQRQTGFMEFSLMGVDGLWRPEGASLEILAVFASNPGTGQFRRFIREMKSRYGSISVWHIWNDDLLAALIRYGFRPAVVKRDGDTLVGLRWDR